MISGWIKATSLASDANYICYSLGLPAWPKDRDVSFKLHSPGPTTVEGVDRGGKMEKLVFPPGLLQADAVLDGMLKQ